jgi:vancomycin resistance protein VanW
MHINTVEQPQYRSRLRKYAGKTYFIAKRHLKWWFGGQRFAQADKNTICEHLLIQHRSFLLRPLKDVEMYLQHNKITNLRLAIANIDGVVIRPNETFSLWKMVGRPTAAKGYKEGLTLENGKIGKGVGGGLCQLGNLLYWLTLHTPLTITERWRHSFDVFPDINRTIPFGCGATLSYNYVDFQLQNNTENTFKINLWLDDEYLNGIITTATIVPFRYKIIETEHLFQAQSWGGYTRHNRIIKQITNTQNQEISEEFVTENHAVLMYTPFLQ